MGILANVERQSGLLNSVIIPEGTARREFGVASPGNVQVETKVGAASLIASQMPLALVPTDINALKITAPPEAKRIKAGVQKDLNSLFLLLGSGADLAA